MGRGWRVAPVPMVAATVLFALGLVSAVCVLVVAYGAIGRREYLARVRRDDPAT